MSKYDVFIWFIATILLICEAVGAIWFVYGDFVNGAGVFIGAALLKHLLYKYDWTSLGDF